VSDADNQTGGSGDPRYETPPSKEPAHKKPAEAGSDNDNDVMTEDDLPSGG